MFLRYECLLYSDNLDIFIISIEYNSRHNEMIVGFKQNIAFTLETITFYRQTEIKSIGL